MKADKSVIKDKCRTCTISICEEIHKKVGGDSLPFCRACGKEIPENVRFCPNCGANLPLFSRQIQPPVPEKTRMQKRRIFKWIAVGVAAIVIISVAVFLLGLPRPEIVLTDGHDGLQGLNYVVYVDVSVRNNGGSGWVTVHAELSGGGRFEQQEQRVHVGAGETKNVQFVFDVSFWNSLFSSMQYRVWATPF